MEHPGHSRVPSSAQQDPEWTRRVYAAGAEALNRLSQGVLVVDTSLRVLFRNRVATRVLSEADGLLENGEGLTATTAVARKELRNAVRTAGPAGSTLTLHRRHPRPPLTATVLADRSANDGERMVVMFVTDRERPPVLSTTVLSCCYGLTRAEAQFATLLVSGLSVEDAAERLTISPHTARTHLKRILMKTDTNRQAQLVALLLAGPAALLAPDASGVVAAT